MSDQTEKKRLNISIDADLHKKLKLTAVMQDCTVVDFVRDAIVEKLEKYDQKNKEQHK